MQHIGRMYVQYINYNYQRSGTLWEGRHKASLVDAEAYLLKCYRYIEMNPVVANMVKTPEQYRWCSYGWHAWGKRNDVVTDYVLYKQLGITPVNRQHAYRELFKTQIREEDVHVIHESLNYNFPLGNERFNIQVEQALGRQSDKSKGADLSSSLLVRIKSLRPLSLLTFCYKNSAYRILKLIDYPLGRR